MKDKRAVKLLRDCCKATVKAVVHDCEEYNDEEDEVYRRAFQKLTGRDPSQEELDRIFDCEDD